jgi:hypothetical protein
MTGGGGGWGGTQKGGYKAGRQVSCLSQMQVLEKRICSISNLNAQHSSSITAPGWEPAMTPTNGGGRPSFALPKVALPLRIMQRSALTFGVATLRWWRRCR